MRYPTFEALQIELQRLYQEGEYSTAQAVAREGLDQFPEYSTLLYYWLSVLAARAGQEQAALANLNEALQSGVWYGETLLRKSPAFANLQALPEFSELVQAHRKLREQDESRKYPLLVLHSEGRCEAGQEACPLMIALHANAAMAQDSVDFWRPAALAGWLVAAPQSSQAMWRGSYIWDDRQVTEAEILRHFGSLNEQYAIDTQRVVLAGHSMGGEMAIWLALTGAIPARGFIAIGPAGPFMDQTESWRTLIENYPGQGLRGYIIAGEEDESISHENIQTLAAMLNQGGIATEVEEVAHAGHDYAPEFESSILRALEFISA